MGRRRPASDSSDASATEISEWNPASVSTDSGFSGSDTNQEMASPDSTTTSSSSSPTNSVMSYEEQRREQSRQAVRRRRTAECSLFQDLGQALPVTPAVLKSLDKLSVLRVARSFFKLRTLVEGMKMAHAPATSGLINDESIDSMLLHDDAFLVIMSTTGEIIYVSDNVKKSLRCEKHAVVGTNIYDYVHGGDHAEMDRLLSVQDVEPVVPVSAAGAGAGGYRFKTQRNSATVRLRAGAGAGASSSTQQRSIQITGKVFLSGFSGKSDSFFVGVGEPLVNPSDFEFPFPNFTILMSWDWVVTADMKTLVQCSPDMFLGYHAYDDFSDCTPFEMYHPDDLQLVRDGFRKLFAHGHQQVGAYRILAKGGGWAWFVSQASTMVVQKRGKDGKLEPVTYCVGRDFMVSEVMQSDMVLSIIQVLPSRDTKPAAAIQNFPSPAESPGMDLDLEESFALAFDEDELMSMVMEMTADEGWLDELCATMQDISDSDSNCSTYNENKSSPSSPHYFNLNYTGYTFPTLSELLAQSVVNNK